VESYNLKAARQSFQLQDVWTGETMTIDDTHTFALPEEGVAFMKFSRLDE
jgi:hypothetical protein